MLQAEKEKNFWEFIKLLDKENLINNDTNNAINKINSNKKEI